MIFVLFLVFSVFVLVNANIEGKYCKVLAEYEAFKTQLDNYLASRDELCKGQQFRTDCSRIKEEFPEATDGVYRIKPDDGQESFPAFCDMETDEHGWLVIQRRQDGSEDFYRTWFEYMDGFGNLTGEFWLGNEKIHRLTSQGNYTLRVDMTDTKNISTYAEYSVFRLGNMSDFYRLTVSRYSGNAGDKLSRHSGKRFTARNLDLDNHKTINCAQLRQGAWWYDDCHDSNLNGIYTSSAENGIRWGSSRKKKTVMKVRAAR